jgi:hypothetical protein
MAGVSPPLSCGNTRIPSIKSYPLPSGILKSDTTTSGDFEEESAHPGIARRSSAHDRAAQR